MLSVRTECTQNRVQNQQILESETDDLMSYPHIFPIGIWLLLNSDWLANVHISKINKQFVE